MLEKAKACHTQLKAFTRICPNGSPATKEAALALALEHAGTFDWDWAARELLGPDERRVYEAAEVGAWRTYDAATAKPRRAYHAATEDAQRTRNAARAEARRIYVAAIHAALAVMQGGGRDE